MRHAVALFADKAGGMPEGIIEARYDRPVVSRCLQIEESLP
jgi:hypothetical protein